MAWQWGERRRQNLRAPQKLRGGCISVFSIELAMSSFRQGTELEARRRGLS